MSEIKYFFLEDLYQIFLFDLSDYFSMLEEDAFVDPAGNSDVSFSGFARSVDGAAHDGYLYVLVDGFQEFLYFMNDRQYVILQSAAGRTAYQIRYVLGKIEGLQKLLGSLDFLNAVIGNGDPYGIADAVIQ